MCKTKITENDTKGKVFKVNCRKCKQKTNHLVLMSADENGFAGTEDDEFHWTFNYQIIQCQGCETVAFREECFDSDMHFREEAPHETTYPDYSPEALEYRFFNNTPKRINDLYRETIVCYNNDSLTLCAAGIRVLVEIICLENQIIEGDVYAKDQNGDYIKDTNGNMLKNGRKNTLEGKISGLSEKGILREKDAMILHEHRAIGNEALHRMVIHSKDELKIAINIIKSMLISIYETPCEGETLKQDRDWKSGRAIKRIKTFKCL